MSVVCLAVLCGGGGWVSDLGVGGVGCGCGWGWWGVVGVSEAE